MALVVGELAGLITLDDRAFETGLRQAEQAMRRTGQRLEQDADDAGQQAGTQLGQGLVRGADGQWRNMQGELVDAVTAAAAEAESQARRGGQQVGDRFGDGVQTGARQAGDELADGVRRGAGEAEDAAENAGEQASEGFFSRMRGSASQGMGDIAASIREGLGAKLGLAAIGASAGAALMAAISDGMEQQKITGKLAASMGQTPAQAQKYGKIAGKLYADAITEDFQGAADVIGATMAAGLTPPDATNEQIQSIAANLHDLSDTFELDLGQAANAVGQIMKTKLAPDAKTAMDVITRGMQVMGPRADDLADTFNEYSTIFRQLGISASDATGLLSQGMQAGARDTDVVADSLKEFVLITQKGGKQVDDAFKAIGLNGKEMQAAFVEGGPKARKALDKVFDGLRNMKGGVDRNNTALTLFGTKSEDTQQALLALDPSKATAALGEVGGAADKMGNSLRDNASTKLEQFKRGMQQNLVNFLGGTVVPAFTDVRTAIGRIWDDAGKGNPEAADRILAFFDILAQRIKTKVTTELAPRLIEGFSTAGQKVADFIAQNPEQALKLSAIAAAIIVAIATLPLLVAGTLAAAAAIMMYNFTARMIGSLSANLPKWWSAFVGWHKQKIGAIGGVLSGWGVAMGAWFSGLWSRYISGPISRQWNNLMASVRALPGRARGALGSLGSTLSSTSSAAWGRFQSAASAKWSSFMGWLRGLPGRTRSAVAGGLRSALYGPGQNVIQGLWSGISSMGGWLASRVQSFVSSNVVSAAKRFLHIGSPSKLMADKVGHWIPEGVAMGVENNAGVVDDAMSSLVTTPTPSMAMAGAVGAATSGSSGGGTRGQMKTMRVGSDGSPLGDLIMSELRKKIAISGGNVQLVLGQGR